MNDETSENEFPFAPMGEPWQVVADGTVITLVRGWSGEDKSTPMLRGTTPDDWTTVVEIETATDAGLGMATLHVIAALVEDGEEWETTIEYYEGDDEESDDAESGSEVAE